MGHTPGPWPEHPNAWRGSGNRCFQIFLSLEDWQRAAACVNACAGINPEAVPALAEACRSLCSAWECYLRDPDSIGVDIEAEIQDAREALALAEKETDNG